ncbi:MAG: phosphoribosylanthranilate isomerase [bacterium]|jgi:phosphoribosylanthranilate isomerase|nr:phosphoribosylanthranilate isomerase [bacterium]
MKGLVQAAGIRDEEEARLCLAEGVDLLGFPFRLPVHREDLDEGEAARLIRSLDIGARCVLITYLDRAAEIRELADFLGCGWVQVHGAMGAGELANLRRAGPGLHIIRSLIIRGPDLVEPLALLREAEAQVDAFLTDSHDPATGADGATGRVHDWSLSRRLREATTRRLILAGGLHAGNVGEAIRAVGPAGVDAHSGLEDREGAKDRKRVRAFVAAARAGFAEEGGA